LEQSQKGKWDATSSAETGKKKRGIMSQRASMQRALGQNGYIHENPLCVPFLNCGSQMQATFSWERKRRWKFPKTNSNADVFFFFLKQIAFELSSKPRLAGL
jgi:hypothetical protein